ncbi:DUF2971 domain-containing protein [Actinocatenispora thailandica]|nr:DUF2971 domain-containing protein [Actinocatenispora thailandica]
MTDVEYMNDAEELEYAKEPVLDLLLRKADSLASPSDSVSANGNRASILRNIVGEVTGERYENGSRFHVYATCFCAENDLLSQWRAYSGSGGYSIAFATNGLPVGDIEALGLNLLFRPVVYGLESAVDHIARLVDDAAPEPRGHPGTQGYSQAMRLVLPGLATVKNPAFMEEREWRLIMTTWGDWPDLHFRSGSVGIVPYRNVLFERSAVTQVMVGPGSYVEQRMKAVRQLLGQYKEYEGVDVVKSSSPLRF